MNYKFEQLIQKGAPKQKSRSDYEDEDDEDYYRPMHSGLFYRRSSNAKFTYYIDSYIGAPSQYRPLLQCMENMQEGDKLDIFIQSGGGRLDATMAIINGMHSTEGDVTVISNGMTASAAGIILLSAPELVISPVSQFMAHNCTFGSSGKTGEIESDVNFRKKYLDKLLDESYYGFLTLEEISEMKKGVDYYFDSDEILERLERRSKIHQADIAKEAKEQAAKQAAMSPKPATKATTKKK